MNDTSKQKIIVIGGAGYVGLATTVAFGLNGFDVLSIDIDEKRVEELNNGTPPFYEKGMEQALETVLKSGAVSFQTSYDSDDLKDRIVFIAVATPSFSDGTSDFKQIVSAFTDLSERMHPGQIIVIKSTVPVGGVQTVKEVMQPKKAGKDYHVVYNPEFLREGSALQDFQEPDRIVVGGDDETICEEIADLYKDWTKDGVPLIQTDFASAQLIKYAANAFLATRISFINEMASIAEHSNASITDIIGGIGLDERIGSHYLSPGLGFGGPCLEKDLQALIQSSNEFGHRPYVLQSVLEKNNEQISIALKKIHKELGHTLAGKKIAVWGLAFKRDSSDIRASLALRLVKRLAEEEVDLQGYDPMAMDEVREHDYAITLHEDMYDSIKDAEALLVLVDWEEFSEADLAQVKKLMAATNIIDMVNLLDRKALEDLSFSYQGFGQ